MSLLLSCIGRRGYIASFFRPHISPDQMVIGTADSPWNTGFHSCDHGYIIPSIGAPGYIESLLRICDRHQVTAIFSFLDHDIGVLASAREAFDEKNVALMVPSTDVNEVCFDKWHTYQFLTQHDIPCPPTFSTCDDALRGLDEGSLTFPVIMKPRRGSASQNIFTANSIRELEFFFSYRTGMLAQPRFSGVEYGVDGCSDLKGTLLDLCVKRKITMRSGETDQAQA